MCPIDDDGARVKWQPCLSLYFQSGLFHRGVGINYSKALIALELCQRWSHTYIIPLTINAETKIFTIQYIHCSFPKASNPFCLGCTSELNKNLITFTFWVSSPFSIISSQRKENNAFSATWISILSYLKREERGKKLGELWWRHCSPLCTGPAGHLGCRWYMFCDMINVSRTQVV